ncbi:MAG: DUF2070 family protein [Thermoplasmata archaeon]
MADDSGPLHPVEEGASRSRRFTRLVPAAPRLVTALLYVILLTGALGLVAFAPAPLLPAAYDAVLLFLLPAVAAGFLTGPVAGALGGKFSLRRSFLLAVVALALELPFFLLGRLLELAGVLALGGVASAAGILIVAQAPSLWVRQIGLFGMSNPHHHWTLPAALLQPGLTVLLLFLVVPPGPLELVAAVSVLLVAFLAAAELLRQADRPLRREFGAGVGLLRPLLEHIGSRDPAGTRQLEEFFRQRSIESDLRITLVQFRNGETTRATLVLATVHPGPFAALGGSDLPRKLSESMGAAAGTVFVPHTPCNHDLDLPGEAELDRVRSALSDLSGHLTPSARDRASPLLAPRPGSLVRAQVLGDTVITVITQAPAASDDIDYSIVDPFYGREFAGERPVLAFIDAHNSYDNDTGDITYGSPVHRELARDLEAAVTAALGAARPGPIRVGLAVRGGYSVAAHGIGSQGIRVLAVEAAGSRTAYILIDANNLVAGIRQKILDSIADRVGAAEVMTTDNHVVHEVDGSVNVLGERYPAERLLEDIGWTLDRALADLAPVTVAAGSAPVPAVRVLGPGYTARLLTSLRDTIDVFRNAVLISFLLMVTVSAALVALLR